jgi:hypothetical protein
MDTLVNTLSEYIDFLVLGAFGLLVLSLPFAEHRPLSRGWNFLIDKCLPGPEVDHYSRIIRVSLGGGIVFVVFYFSGYMFNAFGHSLLHTAHMRVIRESADYFPPKPSLAGPDVTFFLRPLHLYAPDQEEYMRYSEDTIRQARWEICDKASFDDVYSGPIRKQARLIRGAVAVLIVLTPLSLVGLLIGVLIPKRETRARHLWWSFGSLVAASILYWLVFMPMYWNTELDLHTTLWATFPPDDKMADRLTAALPCPEDAFKYAIRNNARVTAEANTSTRK